MQSLCILHRMIKNTENKYRQLYTYILVLTVLAVFIKLFRHLLVNLDHLQGKVNLLVADYIVYTNLPIYIYMYIYRMPLINRMSLAPGLFLISIRAERLKLASETHFLLRLEIIMKLYKSLADFSGRVV